MINNNIKRDGYDTRLFFLIASILIIFVHVSYANTNLNNDYNLTNKDSTDIIFWRASVASVAILGGVYYMSGVFKDNWGESDSKKWLWKTNDWNGDGLAQVDEISHCFTGYKLFQFFRGVSKWIGLNDKTSNIIAFSIAEGVLVWVELIDAYNPTQGFGITDMVTDTVGILFELLRMRYPFAQRFDIKASYRGFEEIPNNLIMATTFAEYDNSIFWLTYSPSDKLPINIALGYGSSRYKSNSSEPRRRLYAGVGISGKDLISLFNKKAANSFGGLFDWYEFSFYVKFYESDPIKQDYH